MTVPTYDQFIEPLLRYLAEHVEGARIVEACDAIATRVELSADDRAEMLPSGKQLVYRNRIGWAHDRLKRAGLSSSPRRGIWKLTEAGAAFASKNKAIRPAELERLASVDRTSRLRPRMAGDADAQTAQAVDATSPATSSPEERIDEALAELRESVARDLLETIGRAPPEFFEQLVLDLFHAMGYGTSRADVQRVGGSGDEGIDGIISLDRLGLEKVYVQAKRWKNTVGSPEVQAFMGALQLQSASKGVLITTSAFTRDARDASAKARGSIVLVDGARLTALMMEHRVGVVDVPLRVPKVDHDYFEDA
jgi:restriction system protein